MLVSSHLLAELSQVADRYVVIDRGRVLAQASRAELAAMAPGETVVTVEADDPAGLDRLVREAGWRCETVAGGAVRVHGAGSARAVAEAAQRAGVLLTRVDAREQSLEDVVLALTGGDR